MHNHVITKMSVRTNTDGSNITYESGHIAMKIRTTNSTSVSNRGVLTNHSISRDRGRGGNKRSLPDAWHHCLELLNAT